MNETELKIRVIGDPVLRKRVKPVKEVTPSHRELLSRMARIMYDSKGIGLAASQVGIEESLIVIDIGEGLYKLVNPRIVRKEGTFIMEEGCLSVPGVSIRVKRAKKILVEAIGQDARPVSIEAVDLLACVFQHEIDHLNGRLIVDYSSLWDKLAHKKKLKRLEKEAYRESVQERGKKSRAL
jgi:peptide deformylase